MAAITLFLREISLKFMFCLQFEKLLSKLTLLPIAMPKIFFRNLCHIMNTVIVWIIFFRPVAQVSKG